MVEQDYGSRRSSAGRVVLSATGWAAAVTSSSATGSVGGEPPAWRGQAALPDPLCRGDSGGSVDRTDPDAAPVSHPATTWAYSGLALETRSSGEYRCVQGPLQRSHKPIELRGLHKNHNHDGKAIFKGAAVKASTAGPFPEFYTTLLSKGMKPAMARLASRWRARSPRSRGSCGRKECASTPHH
jgi:hypothetical protein